MIITTLILVSLLMTFVPFVVRRTSHVTGLAILGSTIVLGLGLYVGVPSLFGAPAVEHGIWYVDGFSGLLIILISVVQWTATITSRSFLSEEVREGVASFTQVRRYYALLALFVTAMLSTVASDNLGFLWVSLEATTLATTFLVAFYGRASSLEAAWKYLILCSTGIALGLFAVIMVYIAAIGTGTVTGIAALSWSTLMGLSGTFSPTLMKVAFAFALIGYGTKIGLVPLSAWLPDAHSSAPAPISALLSGVLLNAALFTLVRYKSLADTALGGSAYTDGLLLFFGTLTLVVAAAFIVTQTDYKRLLAYSSMEHMGFVVFSLGLGALGAVAAVIELVGHALVKPALFFGAGNILLRYRSTKFARVSGVFRALPLTGALFLAGVLLLLAVPPSPLFVSELSALAAGILVHPIAIAIVLVGLTVALAGFIRFIPGLLFGTVPHEVHERPVALGERWDASHTAMALQLLLAVAFFVVLVTGPGRVVVGHIISTSF